MRVNKTGFESSLGAVKTFNLPKTTGILQTLTTILTTIERPTVDSIAEKPRAESKSIVRKSGRKQTQTDVRISMAPTYTVYRYTLAHGNNSEMIERVLANRSWWKKAISNNTVDKDGKKGAVQTSNQTNVNLIWKQWMRNFNWEQLRDKTNAGYMQKRCINRFPRGKEIGDKDNLFRNLWHLSNKKQIDVFDYVPLTYSFRMREKEFMDDFQRFCQFFLSQEKGCHIDEVEPM